MWLLIALLLRLLIALLLWLLIALLLWLLIGLLVVGLLLWLLKLRLPLLLPRRSRNTRTAAGKVG